MTPRRRTSRKRSVASSSAKRLERAVFYLDESIYSRLLGEALEQAGVSVRRPGVDVPFGTADEAWLATAGAHGWIVLMRDQRVRHRALEIQALRNARVGAFVLTAFLEDIKQLLADPDIRQMDAVPWKRSLVVAGLTEQNVPGPIGGRLVYMVTPTWGSVAEGGHIGS